MMHNDDNELRAALQRAQRQAAGSVPDFAAMFGAAEQRLRGRRTVQFLGLAAAVALLALGLLPSQEAAFTYVDLNELAATTSWTAPSDALLPKHQFDVYREVPQLFESTDLSTNSEEGALL